MRPFHVAPAATEEPTVVVRRSKQDENLMRKIDAFFSKPEHMGKLLPFLHETSKISLRLIEWFVSVYSMKNTVDYFIDEEYFNVYLDYHAEMDVHRKQRFDPFARKWRKHKGKRVYYGIHFYYTEDDFVVTTVAQLNFFKWFISKRVLNYMVENRVELHEEMLRFTREKKRRKRERERAEALATVSGTSTKHQQLSPFSKRRNRKPTPSNRRVRVAAMKRVTKKNVEVYVSFD